MNLTFFSKEISQVIYNDLIYMRKEAKQPKILDVFSTNSKSDLIQNSKVTPMGYLY